MLKLQYNGMTWALESKVPICWITKDSQAVKGAKICFRWRVIVQYLAQKSQNVVWFSLTTGADCMAYQFLGWATTTSGVLLTSATNTFQPQELFWKGALEFSVSPTQLLNVTARLYCFRVDNNEYVKYVANLSDEEVSFPRSLSSILQCGIEIQHGDF